MIHVDSIRFADESDEGLCELESEEGVSAETSRRLACDAPHVTVKGFWDGVRMDLHMAVDGE